MPAIPCTRFKLNTPFTSRQAGEAWDPSNKGTFFGIWGGALEKKYPCISFCFQIVEALMLLKPIR
jgi:hypothetical protein